MPEESASYYHFVPIGVRDGALEVGLTDPDSIEARDAVNFIASRLGIPYKLYLISPQDFERVRESYKGLSGEVTKALQDSDWTRGYILASQLVQTIDGIQVNRAFIGAKETTLFLSVT